MPTVRLANCRHPFGGSLSLDAVVDGVYPDRRYCLILSQPGETYIAPNGDAFPLRAPCAYVNIPAPTLHCAQSVVGALTKYDLCSVFRDEPIKVSLAWEDAPDAELTLTL